MALPGADAACTSSRYEAPDAGEKMRLSIFLVLFFIVSPVAIADDHELLNVEERLWLDALDRPLIVGSETQYHPYNFIDDNGDLSGVTGDYMQLLQQRLGFEYEVIAYNTFADLLAAAEAREVDIVPLLIPADERTSYLNFTQQAYATQDRIFTRQEVEGTLAVKDLAGMRVGSVEGYANNAKFSDDYPEIDLVLVGTELDGLRGLSLGRIDAFISELGTSSYYIQREAITNLRVAGEIYGPDPQTFGSRNDWPMLNKILDKGLASITDDEHRKIQQRWINLGEDAHEHELPWRRLGITVGIGTLLLGGVLIWSFSLRQQVAKRTLQLQQEHTERRAIEADKLRLAVAVEQSAEFVLVIDTTANIEYANHSFINACGGLNLEDKSLDSLTDVSTANTMASVMDVIATTGLWQGQVILARAQGEPMKVQMTVAPIYNDRQEVDGYVVTGRDVTKQEQLEARLRRGEKLSALGTLAGGIAHDFNNLLMPIFGYTEMIRSEGPPQLEPYLKGIQEASERARDLITRIMVFGREGSGEMAPVNLKDEIDDALSFFRSLIPTTINLETKIYECGTILGDRTQIQQILLNLCSNASDAMIKDGGTLTIKLEQRSIAADDESQVGPGEYALLTVSDTGVGMSETTRVKIFDPYFSDKQQASGTGLGLSIVHGIVELHGGIIRVYSAPDKGATFRIFLPITSEQAPSIVEPDKAKITNASGATVLLVDDDELVLNTVKAMLSGLGYSVSAWSDPDAALTEFMASPEVFDAVLTDYTMPNMTGIQFATSIAEVRAETPVLIMTGNRTALKNSGLRSIDKPMKLRALADHMTELLS